MGSSGMKKLLSSRVAVFGVGGVGGFTAEALVRTGIGQIDIIDDDKIAPSNINRQIIATTKTIGMYKVDALETRLKEINPDVTVNKHKCFYTPKTADSFNFKDYDYVVDAIDTVTGKIQLVVQANGAGTKIISSMGAGNKLDPTAFMVDDIYNTSVCPLARVMRQELKKRGIKKLKVVYSKETPIKPIQTDNTEESPLYADTHRGNKPKRQTPGSVAFVPSVAGLIIAGEVIKDIIKG